METNSGGLESEDLMEMEDGEGSDLDDEEEELDDPISSPFQLALSDPASAATSTASSPPNNEDLPITPYTFSGKPLSIKRGRGRPRREGDKAIIRRSGGGAKVRRTKTTGYMRGIRRVKSLDRSDFDFSNIIPSSNDENLPMLDSDFGLFGISEREKMLMALEENPYPPEQWPGKVCALCNLGERSQLGQGDLMRLLCPDGFTPQRSISSTSHLQSMSDQVPDNESGDKSPRGPVTCRRQKSFNKCRMLSQNNEYIDELSIIGFTEEPDLQSIFEPLGIFFVHRRCATWSDRVIQPGLPNIGPIILQSTSRKCSYCNHFGASLACNADVCSKYYHFPCATAAGAFQDSKAVTNYCVQHLVQVPLVCESAVCYTCKMHGDIANLMFCSSCGEHYHGICVGLAQTPGIRAGWQCRKCRICQICRSVGDETKLMPCEQCDKVYHTTCQRPVVTSIPKYGWKCRCCRVCGDCGSRTPGAGSSSRWHNHYSVCDSCYQQRNKGYACPICGRSYRAHAQREMVQCITCLRFVHGTCDPEADMMTYQVRKDGHPDYEYVCGVCKSDLLKKQQIQQQRNSFEDGDSFSHGSQDYLFDDAYDFDYGQLSDDSVRFMGLGRGKPYSASKIAKKRLGLSVVGRPKGIGKGMAGKLGFSKRQRLVEFGRKRGPKSKMRGMFGVPGVGLQKPTSDGSRMDEEPGVENRLVLCSVKDKYVLNQDICVMCGALGTDQEGCLISCVQCGQCYHPYCVNVKVTRVILQKGWRCLDCTVCEGCGHRHDESRLILCDECDISFHIYCMDPPLEYVPHGNWKCKWCAICQMCGATDPGFNCTWMNSYTECGPCASHTACASCSESYSEGDLIVQCIQCERWLHGSCDSIRTEKEAEKCVEDGYNCILCRPRDVPPPHLQLTSSPKPSTPCKSPDIKSNTPYFMDGISLQEIGYIHIKSLTNTPSITRKKRKKFHPVQDKEAGIMATIESVVAGSNMLGGGLDDSKLELMDIKEDPQDLYKEGMLWTKEDGTPPEGFTLYTMESGVSVLRRKRQRNLQKLGIGGFIVRPRGIRGAQDNDDVDMLPGQLINESLSSQSIMDCDKPRRKPNRRKPKSKVFESYPPHIQEAFFGKLSLETAKGLDSTSDSEEESIKSSKIGERTIQLSQEELRAVVAVTKHEKSLKQLSGKGISNNINKISNSVPIVPKEEDESDTEVLKDVLTLPGDLLDTDLVNTIMNEDDDELTKNTDALRALGDSNLPDDSNSTSALKETKDELTDILGSHFNIESIPNINSKDVEDIFKNVLTDESQESQESSSFSMSNTSAFSANGSQSSTSHPLSTAIRPTSLPTNNLNSPVGFPPQSPYHSEYSNSPQFSEPRSPWVTVNDTSDLEPASTPGVTTTYNQRSAEKMKADEGLGSGATISAVLYANMNHSEWKTDYPVWNDRYKQIIKKWRTLSTEQRAPYLQQARDNRSALRMKKQQQDQEKINQQQKTAREAEQERQWKQLQAIRQQQQQQHHVVLQEQRTQAIANVQRSLSDGAQPFMTDQVGVLQVTSQQISPSSPSSTSPQFYPLNIKGNQISNSHPPQSKISQSPALPSASSSNANQTIIDTGNLQKLSHPPTLHNKPPLEPTIHMPTTPRLQFTTTRPNLQAYTSPTRQGDAPEMNPQLRDLLQRQQFKKLDEQLLPGKGQQRVWPPNDLSIQDSDQSNVTTPAATDVTFRQPLPPSTSRPKVATSGGLVLRQQGSVVGVRIPGSDPRMQSVDFRMKLLLQQQRGVVQSQQSPLQQSFQQGGQSRISSLTNVRSSNVEQYEQILQKQAQIQNVRQQTESPSSVPQSIIPIQRVPSIDQQVVTTNCNNDSSSNDQEIPDNVTAELEKLEQETGTMVELQGVSEILGGLGEDDDDILAEMGADFNILEYADPELDTLTGGEKTNILDSLDLVEPEPDKPDKREIKARVPVPPTSVILTRPNVILKSEPTMSIIPTSTTSIMSSRNLVRPSLPPPLAVSQHQASSSAQTSIAQLQLTPQQQMHQQMLLQVQHASTSGQPVSAGSKLLSDGVVNVVTSSNNVSLAFPANYAQRILNTHIQLQNQKLRLGTIGQGPRVALPSPTGSPQTILTELTSSRINLAPPPPPPPYPHPPPPYPGSSNTSQEQPLLLEDLLEQEKREQEKQLQTQTSTTSESHSGSALLSDHDFERLKADVLNSNIGLNNSGNVNVPGQNLNTSGTQIRSNFCSPNNANQWQQSPVRPSPVSTPQASIDPPQIPTFNMTLLPAPPLPPENIVSEQDRQAQVLYEQWLNNQNAILTQQLKYYETEVQKLRKIRKSLNSKQRQLRKSGNQLPEADAIELQRISAEQAVLQKHLESSRKQSRQHGMLIQEYRNKQQAKQRPMSVQSPMMVGQQSQSPLNLPNSSPIQHPPQSPLMSPSPSPMMVQHNSPLQSPRPIVSHSPGLGVVTSVIHSPSNTSSNMSPRIGTPHSQSEGSPGSVPSPSQVCLPPPMPRMTSPQHRRIATSPITYSAELRPGMQQTRFVRPPITDQQHRPRLSISTANFLQRSSTPSPLNSPPPQQIQLTSQQQQQLLQRQLQQQALLLQQQNSPDGNQQSAEGTMHHSQRALQLIQQRQLIIRQQMLQQQVQQQQTQVLTSQQHQVMVQQQIAKQQQLAQIQAQVQNVRINPQSQIVNQPPGSPMPPRSPMINQGQQIMSPHSVHSQPTSPMINLNPNSPMARSPALHQTNSQPPNSPMVQHHQVTSPLPRSPIIGLIKSPLSIRRPPSTNSNSSPIMLDHPMNIENPSTPRTQYTPPSYVDNDLSNGGSGGGNPNNPHNPLPMCGRFGFFKLGLRGGTPMWSLGRGAKRVPTNSDNKEDKIDSNHISTVSSKIKRESHLNKVSILKKKASTSKSNLKSLTIGKASSLVSSDYNEFDDSSSTPPVTPPPSVASSSRGLLHKSVGGKKLLEQSEIKDEIVVDNNMRCENVMDYDDDNDGAVVSTEVSLNSVAQQADSDDITVIETFSQNDLTDTISSPLEPGQIGEDYLLFPGNMVVDISNNVHYSDKEEDDEEEEYGEQIVNVAIQSPTPSEEELFIQGKTKQVDGLTLNIVHGLSSNQLLAVTDTPDSPEQEELNVDPSPEHYSQNTDEEILSHVDDSQVVLITRKDLDKTSNVDYEQLIDVTNEKIMKRDTTSSNRLSDIHKYTTKSTTANLQSVNIPITSVSHAITLNTKTTTINLSTQKLSSTSTIISNNTNSSKTNILGTNVITRTAKFTNPNSPTLTSIILPIKTTTSPAITIVGSSSSRFTIPVISASAISKLTNVKVIDKPSSSLSLAAHDACLPKKIFDDESSVSPDSSTCEDEKFKLDFGDEKFKTIDEKQCVNVEGESMENNDCNLIKNDNSDCLSHRVGKHSLDNINEIAAKQLDTVQISNTSITDHLQRLNSPAVISNAPELKMTAQVVQGKANANVQMTLGNVETIQASYVTTRDSIDCSNDSDNDSKSVVISIPSPTPSQEQLLDNIALQALENRRREGKRITSEFDTFEDVLDMIENITGETPTLLEANIKDKIKCDDITKMTKQESNENNENKSQDNSKMSDDRKIKSPTELQIPVTVSTSGKSTIMPQLSPLSQPTDLTTNMANVSQQLRTLLSSLNTTTVTTSPNIATIVKSDIHNKDKVTGTCSSRIIQTSSILSPLISNANVIFSSAKQKPVVAFTVPSVGIVSKNILVSSSAGSAFAPITTSLSSGTPNMTVTKVLTTSTSNIVQSIPDHPKLTLVTSVPSSLIQTCNLVTSVSQKPISVPGGTTATSDAQSINKSLNLNAMLQSHPAATVAQIAPGTITTATILGSPITIAKSSFSPSMVHAQPTVVSPVVIQTPQTHSSTTSPFISFSSSGISKPIVATTNLLHSQLTKVNVLRTKSNEDQQQLTVDLIKKEEIKQEPSESLDLDISPPILQKSEFSGCKYSAIQCTSRVEDSQNVLLKQLLQNTACATTSQPLSASTTSGTTSNAPSLPLVPNLEAQLARPVPPTPTSLLPPLLQNENLPVPSKTTLVTRETSFVSKHTTQPVAIQQLHIDVKKCLPPSRTPSRDELLSPPTPRSTCSQDSFIPTPPLYIKKEYQSMSSLPSPLLTPHEVKKEFVDETSQHSEISDHSRPDIHIKEEMDLLDSSEKTTLEQKEELKKMKRRAYQQKRRQIQTMNKEMAGQPKKRARKSSKIDEDYDTYMEGVLAQLRTLPPMVVQEAQLHRNFGIASIFGGGDFSRLGVRNDLKCGELSGSYGNASVTGCSDCYSTKPYGNFDPLPPKPPISTQRGFYETEFPPLRFESEDDRKFELFCRDADTPDSVVSDSSGDEYLQNDAFTKFLGLKLIDDYDEDGTDEGESKENLYGKRPMSPIVPIVVPIPIRLKPLDTYLKDYSENDKENIYKDYSSKSKLATGQAGSLKDSGNVTVTLTLTSSAAEDIMGVLRDLANLLHIPPPTSYQIVERTGTPPSQKLGLYRTKGKDGKEGAPIDIQSILNGAAKFCKHCDVVILRNIIRKKVAELPNLSKWTEIVGDSDEIYFCSGACYMQFSIIHRIPPIPENKAATTIDYISQKETQKKSIMDHTSDNSLNRLSTLGRNLNKQSTISDFMEVDHIKTESIYSTQHEDLDFKQKHFDNFDNTASPKVWRDLRYKHWIAGCLQSNTKYKKPTDKETMELLYRLGITVLPAKLPEDTRRCMFCQNVGDGVADGPARLLNFDVDKWIHLNCGLWSDLVYETVNGALMNLENAIQISLSTVCVYCNKTGATIRCFKTRCSNIYHLPCAIKERCVFYKNKSVFCASHALKNDKDNEITTLSVSRRVYVNRDENRQVAAVMHHASDTSNLLRVGSLIFLNVGQLLPHQLQNFHTANYIYPIGYKIWRFYWSMRRVNKRCRYLCSIHEISGRPEFRVVVQDPPEEDIEFRDLSPKAVWSTILEQIAMLRKENHCLQVFPKYISGEDLFGLTEPAVVRVLESLPGIETLVDYKFKYGRNPLLELPLAVNPSGAARTEPKSRNQFNWKRPHTQRTGSSVRPVYVSTATGIGEAVCPYSKQFVHSKSSQYKKMKQEWKNNIYLARSKIQGLGLYAARDLEKHTMVIEYIGEIIRTELAETREKKYEARNRGIYMFRLDEERVIDATLSGGLARYINHSCNPNCVAEIVEVDRDLRIIIFAKRRIQRGEELAYDYKFDIEDDQHKISCMCGAPNCRKWMN